MARHDILGFLRVSVALWCIFNFLIGSGCAKFGSGTYCKIGKSLYPAGT